MAGGIPAWFLAKRASKETLDRDRLQRLDAELAIAFRVHTKLGIMFNDLSATVLQIREMLKRSFDPRDEAPVQRRVSAFAGKQLLRDISFTADELALFVAVNELDYLSELDLFARRYHSDMVALDTYGKLKTELHNLISDSAHVKFGPGDVILTRTDDPDAAKFRVKARTLESLIVPLIKMMEEDTRMGMRLAKQFDKKLKHHFPSRKVPGFDLGEAERLFPDILEVADKSDARS